MLRGGCVHHDNGVIGANTLDTAEDRRVRILKANGCNAIRSAHNPLSISMVKACDRHGILIMDELTDVWFTTKTQQDYALDFTEWWEWDMESMVAKNYNHPSVIMYSIGNEVSESGTPQGKLVSAAMGNRIKQLDPTRFSTNAVNGLMNVMTSNVEAIFEKLTELGVDCEKYRKEPDGEQGRVERWNFLISSWKKYSDKLTMMDAVDEAIWDTYSHVDVAGGHYMTPRVEQDLIKYPERVYVGSETALAIYEAWPLMEKYPQCLGDFIWTGWDYIGEVGLARPEYEDRLMKRPFPALLGGCACIDITGHPQSQVFLSKVVWGLNGRNPIIAVHPLDKQHFGKTFRPSLWRHTDSIRSWNWRGYEGKTASVEVYCDAPQVRLELDGKEVGSPKPSGAPVTYLTTFDIIYQPGRLVAIALDAAGAEIGRDEIISGGSGMLLSVIPETDAMISNGADAVFIPIKITDDEGLVLPLSDREIKVRVTGKGGHLLGQGSGNPTTAESYICNTTMPYYGRALAVLRSGVEEGVLRVVVSAEGCADVTVEISVVGVPM